MVGQAAELRAKTCPICNLTDIPVGSSQWCGKKQNRSNEGSILNMVRMKTMVPCGKAFPSLCCPWHWKTRPCQLSASYLLISRLLMTLQWSRWGQIRELEFFHLQFRKLYNPNHIWKTLSKVQGHMNEGRTPLQLNRTGLLCERRSMQWPLKGQQEKQG